MQPYLGEKLLGPAATLLSHGCLVTLVVCVRLQRMHVAVEHSAVDEIESQHTHRWDVWKGKECFSW